MSGLRRFNHLLILFLCFFWIFTLTVESLAESEPLVKVYLFYGEGCPHCAKEKVFLYGDFKKTYPNLEINEFEIYKNRANLEILQQISKTLNIQTGAVPFLIIGDQAFIGFAEGVTSKQIIERAKECSENQCPDLTGAIIKSSSQKEFKEEAEKSVLFPEDFKLKFPFWGEIETKNFSLPALTAVFGLVDGFNPCAMWTLVFLISLLLGMKDRKKMWLLGGAFIFVSGFVYFLFMSAWLNLILFFGFVVWIRILIGVLALAGASYSLKDFLTNPAGVCKVGDEASHQRTFERMKKIIEENNLWLSLAGIAVLAFAVNLVELVCSAGLPAVYTQILTMNKLASWQYYFYIVFYLFFFMLDDILVFVASMKALELAGMSGKYSRFSRLIGGFIMLLIGLLLIFRPEWLMFG